MSQSIISSKTMRNGPHSDCCATWVAQGQQREEAHQYAKILIMLVLPWAQYFFLFFFFLKRKGPPFSSASPVVSCFPRICVTKHPALLPPASHEFTCCWASYRSWGLLFTQKKILLPPELHSKPLLNYRNSENQGMCITTADCTHKCPRNMPTKPVSHRRASPQTQRCHMQHCLHLYSHSDIQ